MCSSDLSPAATAVISGEVPVMFAGSVNANQIKAGKLRIIAATGANRSPMFPDTPSISEFYPGYQISTWMGLFGPAKLPEPILARWRSEIRRVLAMPDVRERLTVASSLDIFPSTTEEFTALIRSDFEKYGRIVNQIGLKAD